MILGLSARYSTSDSFLAPYLGPTFLKISFLWACVAPPLSLAKRIKQEEAMLEKEFGHEWKTYCQRTWRLIPFVW
jgi:protein-S-isoprenylcysteine O-methyltransferase Ste14